MLTPSFRGMRHEEQVPRRLHHAVISSCPKAYELPDGGVVTVAVKSFRHAGVFPQPELLFHIGCRRRSPLQGVRACVELQLFPRLLCGIGHCLVNCPLVVGRLLRSLAV